MRSHSGPQGRPCNCPPCDFPPLRLNMVCPCHLQLGPGDLLLVADTTYPAVRSAAVRVASRRGAALLEVRLLDVLRPGGSGGGALRDGARCGCACVAHVNDGVAA